MKSEFFKLGDHENRKVEFKERYTKLLLKTVSAFSNYHDGRIVIGVTDKGNVIGVEDTKQQRLNIENAINDSIHPRPYYEIDVVTHNSFELILISVFKGDFTPYLYERKAYQRPDTSTVEVDKIQYDELVLLGKNLSYDGLAYSSSDLKFDLLEKKLKESIDIREVDQNILKSLEMFKNGLYNNAAALLADKNKFNEIGLDLICYEDDSLLEIKIYR